MKKLIIVLMFLLPLAVFGQRVYKVDSLIAPTLTVDTTVYVKMFTGTSWSIEFNFKDFDADSTIIDLGACAEPDSNVFNRLDNSALPLNLLQDSTVLFSDDDFPARYLEIKITTDTVTAGKKCFYWITKN